MSYAQEYLCQCNAGYDGNGAECTPVGKFLFSSRRWTFNYITGKFIATAIGVGPINVFPTPVENRGLSET